MASNVTDCDLRIEGSTPSSFAKRRLCNGAACHCGILQLVFCAASRLWERNGTLRRSTRRSCFVFSESYFLVTTTGMSVVIKQTCMAKTHQMLSLLFDFDAKRLFVRVRSFFEKHRQTQRLRWGVCCWCLLLDLSVYPFSNVEYGVNDCAGCKLPENRLVGRRGSHIPPHGVCHSLVLYGYIPVLLTCSVILGLLAVEIILFVWGTNVPFSAGRRGEPRALRPSASGLTWRKPSIGEEASQGSP